MAGSDLPRYSIGLDFGTESARALVVDIRDGRIAGQASSSYAHGVIDRVLPESAVELPADYALQHPQDWLDSMASACRDAMNASSVTPEQVIGIGVDFTSCTMLPCFADGTPVCMFERFQRVPLAWPKLWKHHGAKAEAEHINAVARKRKEKWLARYGGTISLEWFFPKILETLKREPGVYDAADVWLEAGDWLVWQLVNGPFPDCDPDSLTRSTCQAGYKAMWNGKTGYPSPEFFKAVHPKLADVETKLPGVLNSPGRQAGILTSKSAALLGLREGTPVATATIDAHAGVPGAGVAVAGTMVMVLGTSSCHMMNSKVEKLAPGIAGVVEDGILPGFFGYETGQASVGDAFAWLVDTFNLSHETLMSQAAGLPPGAGGVIAFDWFNGCRTPLMDPSLSGAFVGLTLGTTPAQLYRALIEATAFGVRWIVETLRDSHVPVKKFVASGGLPARNPLLMQIYADVLDEKISLAESDQSVALGAAILGCHAAGKSVTGYASVSQAIAAMARQRTDLVYQPDTKRRKAYDALYGQFRNLADPEGHFAGAMRALSKMRA